MYNRHLIWKPLIKMAFDHKKYSLKISSLCSIVALRYRKPSHWQQVVLNFDSFIFIKLETDSRYVMRWFCQFQSIRHKAFVPRSNFITKFFFFFPFQPNQFTPHPFQNKHQETATQIVAIKLDITQTSTWGPKLPCSL